MELHIHRGWRDDPGLLDAVRGSFAYPPGEDRVGGYLYGDGQNWPDPLAVVGPALLVGLHDLLGVEFPIALFQAYLNGSGCDWHADEAFDTQAILSLGVTRTFGVRKPPDGEPFWHSVSHGDLLVMPSGFQRDWQHCVPVEAVTGERVSLVFRTVARS